MMSFYPKMTSLRALDMIQNHGENSYFTLYDLVAVNCCLILAYSVVQFCN